MSACDPRSRTPGSSAASSLSHSEPHRPGLQCNDKNWLDQSRKTNLLECAVGISAHKKLIHTLPLKADRPTTRAAVVGCAISATPNYLKLHRPTKSNPLFSSNRAKTLKLCTHSRPTLFVPWRFLDAGQLSLRSVFVAGVQKPARSSRSEFEAARRDGSPKPVAGFVDGPLKSFANPGFRRPGIVHVN